MTEANKKLVKKTVEYANSISEVAKQQSPEAKEAEREYHTKLTRKEMTFPEVEKIMPRRRLRSLSSPTQIKKYEKQREYENEYVVGIFENVACPHAAATFWKNNLPGDDYAEWYIPAGRPVAIPRHVAKHLSQNCKYHIFKNVPKQEGLCGPDDFMDKFEIVETKARLDFKPVNAFG